MMKILILFPLLLLSGFCASAQDSALPSRFELLSEKYEKAVKRATRPITEKYIEELRKLRSELTESGNLKEALRVEHALRDLGAIEITLQHILKRQPWRYTANGNASRIIFKDDGVADVAGTSNDVWKWEVSDNNVLVLRYPGKENGCKFVFDRLEAAKITGKTIRDGHVRTLEPLEEPGG